MREENWQTFPRGRKYEMDDSKYILSKWFSHPLCSYTIHLKDKEGSLKSKLKERIRITPTHAVGEGYPSPEGNASPTHFPIIFIFYFLLQSVGEENSKFLRPSKQFPFPRFCWDEKSFLWKRWEETFAHFKLYTWESFLLTQAGRSISEICGDADLFVTRQYQAICISTIQVMIWSPSS